MTRTALKTGVAGVLLIAVAAGWYFFRPERAFLDRRADDPPPTAVTAVLMTGRFEPRAHEGRGRAEIVGLAGGQRVLRLTSLETSDGPDLEVYLLGSADAASARDLEGSGYLSLGPLKGNLGSQNYAIPASAELARFRAIAIWCRRFGVNFTTARLDAATAQER